MAYTSTETKVQVLAGDASHRGILEVGYVHAGMTGARTTPEPPRYDYEADAVAVVEFMHRFLPMETYEAVVADIIHRY